MSNRIIRDGSGKILYKLEENKLYNKTIVRDSAGHRVASFSNKEPSAKTTSEKLRNK